MMDKKKQKRLIHTAQGAIDFAFSAVAAGGLETLLPSEGASLTGKNLIMRAGIWGGVYGLFLTKRYGMDRGIRAGLAASAGFLVGNIGTYIFNNYETIVQPFM